MFNITGANITRYTKITNNVLNFSVMVWESGTTNNVNPVLVFDFSNATINYNEPPPTPQAPINLTSAQGNFWVNYTWEAGTGGLRTDSYNLSVNGDWTNGTTLLYNYSVVGAHNWSNISVYAFNNSGSGSLNLTPAKNETQVKNNVPDQGLIGNKAITAGNLLTFTVSASDADSDKITYGTNATKGALDSTTGLFSWMPGSADAGTTYFWLFNSSDSYGGMADEAITVDVADTSGTYINGTVKSGGIGVGGVTVSTNTSITTTTDASGFYSLAVTAGAYQLTAAREPVYYTNSSVTAAVVSGVVVRDIELIETPTGTITGSVTNA